MRRDEQLKATARMKAMMEREEDKTRYPGNGREAGERTSEDGEDYTEAEARERVEKRTDELLNEAAKAMNQALMDN